MCRRTRHGFTLVELLVVILIIAILMAIIAPAAQSIIALARRTQCSTNLKELGTALHTYHSGKEHFPVGNVRGKFWTFQSKLLPQLGRRDLYRKIDLRPRTCFRANMAEDGQGVPSVPLQVMLCPSDARAGQLWTDDFWGTYAPGNYFGVIGTTPRKKDGMLFSGRTVSISDVRDGMPNTIFVGERGNVDDPVDGLIYGWWACGSGRNRDGNGDNLLATENGLTAGGNEHENRFHFWSEHIGGGGNFLFVSGNVKWLTYDTDYHLLQHLATRAGAHEDDFDFDIDDNRVAGTNDFEVSFNVD